MRFAYHGMLHGLRLNGGTRESKTKKGQNDCSCWGEDGLRPKGLHHLGSARRWFARNSDPMATSKNAAADHLHVFQWVMISWTTVLANTLGGFERWQVLVRPLWHLHCAAHGR